MLKRCSKCLTAKPLSSFSRRKGSRDGLNGHCRACVIQKNRKWKTEHPVNYLCSMLLAHAKRRARQRGRDFDLTIDDIKNLVTEQCPVLGTPLLWEYGHGKGLGDHSPSLDRIDNSKGYTRGNIAIISHRANSMKNSCTIQQLENILEYMKKDKKKNCDTQKQTLLKSQLSRPKKMTDEEKQIILDLHAQGWSCRKIASQVKSSKSTVAALIRAQSSC